MAYSKIKPSGHDSGAFKDEKQVCEYLVDAQVDLWQLNAYCLPGSIAHTAGYALIWELANDGTTWTAL